VNSDGRVLGGQDLTLSGRHRTSSGWLPVSLAVSALTFAVIALVARAVPLSNNIVLIVAAGSPYVVVIAVAGLALSVMCRRTVVSVVAVAIVVATVAVQVPWYYFGRPPVVGDHVELRVLSSNLRKGQADTLLFVGLARASADVVAVSELTAEAVGRFNSAGMAEAFPYSVLNPAAGAGGIGLWSRFPLAVLSQDRRGNMLAARLRIHGVRFAPVVASVHVISPLAADGTAFDNWRYGITAAKAELIRLADAAVPGAVIVAGDFNSTPDMRQFRDLLNDGYRDSVEQIGAGYGPTFPSNIWFPPLLTIDHVLTRQAAASSIRTVEVPGSDHRSLLATIDVPTGTTSASAN
jgi:endonuclease/exonuclease/phosphatase (EEP) superfamily protein YafD